MENLKIKVNNEAESKEAQELFFELGYAWLNTKKEYQDIGKYNYISSFNHSNRMELGMGYGAVNHKEITIPQLKDMVVLKRNDHKDANVYQDGDVPCLYDLYLTSDNNLYFHSGLGGWKLSSINDDEDYRRLLKPIQNNDLPFIDSREPLNDKIASAEVARQKQSNQKTIDAMREAEDIINKKHSHYKKDVSHLGFIDVYRVLNLFEVESHAIGHAVKKLLCSGQRGAKDKAQDIQEAIDSLNRELEMMRENESGKD